MAQEEPRPNGREPRGSEDEEERRSGGEGASHLSDQELADRIKEDIKRLRMVDVAGEFMITLVTLGYQKMGLTGETLELRNLPDARLAIELLRSLIETLEREKVGDVGTFRATLAAMQLQFARAAAVPDGVLPGDATAGPAEPAAGSAAGPAAGASATEAGQESAATAEGAPQDDDAARAAKKLWVPPGARGGKAQ
jgi:hypothetical protein